MQKPGERGHIECEKPQHATSSEPANTPALSSPLSAPNASSISSATAMDSCICSRILFKWKDLGLQLQKQQNFVTALGLYTSVLHFGMIVVIKYWVECAFCQTQLQGMASGTLWKLLEILVLNLMTFFVLLSSKFLDRISLRSIRLCAKINFVYVCNFYCSSYCSSIVTVTIVQKAVVAITNPKFKCQLQIPCPGKT